MMNLCELVLITHKPLWRSFNVLLNIVNYTKNNTFLNSSNKNSKNKSFWPSKQLRIKLVRPWIQINSLNNVTTFFLNNHPIKQFVTHRKQVPFQFKFKHSPKGLDGIWFICTLWFINNESRTEIFFKFHRFSLNYN